MFEAPWDAIVAGTIAAITGIFFIVRHIWSATKQIAILDNRITNLEALAQEGKEDHDKIFKLIGDMEKSLASQIAKLDLHLTNGK